MGAGSQETVTGYKYKGSFAQALCMGRVDILEEIRNGDTVIWSGPANFNTQNSHGYTEFTTTLGRIRFYWGEPDQDADPELNALTINGVTGRFPAMPSICYFIGFDLDFGTQTVPPTLAFIVARYTPYSGVDVGVSRISLSDKGSGYTPDTNFLVSVTGGGGSGCVARAFVGSDGRIYNVNIENPGHSYSSDPAVTIPPPSAGVTALGFSSRLHETHGDSLIPEAMLNILGDPLYGGRMDYAAIDTASFLACAQQTLRDQLSASLVVDNQTSCRDLLGKLFLYSNCFPYYHKGKIYLKAVRDEDVSGAVQLDESAFMEEPVPSNKGFDATWNVTRLTYLDILNNWQEGSTSQDDPANYDIIGERVEKSFSFPWVTRRQVADKLARRLSITGGIPPMTWKMKLLPSWDSILPGDMIKVSMAALGLADKVMRVTNKRRGGPQDRHIELDAIEEQHHDSSADSIDSDGDAGTPYADDFSPVNSIVRLGWLPTDLQDGKADAIFAAVDRPNPLTIAYKLFWTWNPGVTAYQLIQNKQTFPASGRIVWWEKMPTGGNWLLRVEFPTTGDADRMIDLTAIQDVNVVLGHRNWKSTGTPLDEYRMDNLWGTVTPGGVVNMIDSFTVEVEVSMAAHSTPDLVLEGGVTDSISPAKWAYFGQLADFVVMPTNTIAYKRNQGYSRADTDRIRYFKALTRTSREQQVLDDVPAFTYDRNDSTASSDGTLSTDWGDRPLTAAEMFDIAAGQVASGGGSSLYVNVGEIDRILWRKLNGAATGNDERAVRQLDSILGFMVGKRIRYYNEET